MDKIRKLILEKLREHKLERKQVSIEMGRNDTYLSQFLIRGHPVELRERDRTRLAEILRVPENELRGPSLPQSNHTRGKNMSNPESLIAKNSSSSVVSNLTGQEVPIDNEKLFGPEDLPVFATLPQEDGSLEVTHEPVSWVSRPPMVSRVKKAYSLIVSDNLMSPEHKAGSYVIVNPHLPPRIGESSVFRGARDDGTPQAVIREYRGETETHWKVRQHKPEKDALLKKAEWPLCHKAVANYFT